MEELNRLRTEDLPAVSRAKQAAAAEGDLSENAEYHASRERLEVLLERLQDLMRIQVEVAHDLPEHVPLDLRERQADVLVGQQRVLAPAIDVARESARRRRR